MQIERQYKTFGCWQRNHGLNQYVQFHTLIRNGVCSKIIGKFALLEYIL